MMTVLLRLCLSLLVVTNFVTNFYPVLHDCLIVVYDRPVANHKCAGFLLMCLLVDIFRNKFL